MLRPSWVAPPPVSQRMRRVRRALSGRSKASARESLSVGAGSWPDLLLEAQGDWAACKVHAAVQQDEGVVHLLSNQARE